MKIQHKEHKWTVEGVSEVVDKNLTDHDVGFVKICETSGCIVYYRNAYWQVV